jgi:hypothetical protein
VIAFANIASAIFAFIAAVLWGWSSRIKTPSAFPVQVITSHGTAYKAFAGEEVVSSGTGRSPELDTLADALRKQANLSGSAAGFAAVAAFCQAFVAICSYVNSN